jgi:hypothetical protein
LLLDKPPNDVGHTWPSGSAVLILLFLGISLDTVLAPTAGVTSCAFVEITVPTSAGRRLVVLSGTAFPPAHASGERGRILSG